MKVDASTWAKANLWTLPSGELCVRPGLRQLYAAASLREIVGGFSVVNSYTPEVWHYVFDVSSIPSAVGGLDLRLRILDEDFQTFQEMAINADRVPRVITHAIAEGMGLICSPDFPTIFFVVGSGARFADAVDSTNTATTAIAVPRGICTSWCNRVVICNGRSMFVSDPVAATGGDVRTFVAENQNQRPGFIYGVHEGRDGDLVVVTSEGTYALAADAAATGIVGSNGSVWRSVNHTVATSYASSCTVRGRVYGLTRNGWAAIDTETDDEVRLTEPAMPRATFARVSLEDYRTARMFGTDEGPLVAVDGLLSEGGELYGAMHRTDLGRGISSWWWSPVAMKVRGVLRELDGTQMLLTDVGAYAVCGDFDGGTALSSGDDAVRGSLFGVLPPDPTGNRLVRHIDVSAAVGGTSSSIGVSLRGSRKSGALEPDANGYTIGTSTWTQTGRRLTTTPLSSARADFGQAACDRTDDVGVEVEATGCLNRISDQLSVEFSKSAELRPGKVL